MREHRPIISADYGLFEVDRGCAVARLLFVVWLAVVTRFSPGSAGAGGADAASLVRGVAEAVGVASLQLGDAVEALGPGIRLSRRLHVNL